TGAEFASAYRALGTEVTLVSSREKVLPGQDEDAADVLEFVFRNKGMNVLSRSRAASVTRTESGVEVVLADGRRVAGSHCLMAVASAAATVAWPSVRFRTPRTSVWRRPVCASATPDTSSSTVCPAPPGPESTRPVTAPVCSHWPRWRRCRAGSR